jgi:hypothetical protein
MASLLIGTTIGTAAWYAIVLVVSVLNALLTGTE